MTTDAAPARPMRYSPLSYVRGRVGVGAPLPFNVFDSDHTLLLVKGYVIASEAQLEALLERGSLVDLVELHRGSGGIEKAPPELLPELWRDCGERLCKILERADPATLQAGLDEAAAPVQALIQRDPDLAIVQVVQQEASAHVRYGLNHAMHAAIACWLVAGRLGWERRDAQRALKAALTMNLSIFELQGQLAGRAGPPDTRQRQQILSHPQRSRELLELSGVTDPAWLVAVEQHHECTGGTGYPDGIESPGTLATLLQRADVFTTRLSPRSYRPALPADRAARELFARERGSPIVAALVKEFGVYPPGCHVRLASGETGVVVRRGGKVMAPTVAVLLDRRGKPLAQPVTRNTGAAAYAVTGVVPAHSTRARLEPSQFASLLAA